MRAQPPDLLSGGAKGQDMAARLAAVEKHLRKNALQGGTLIDRLQRSACARLPGSSPAATYSCFCPYSHPPACKTSNGL
jgi:hypothetical protein